MKTEELISDASRAFVVERPAVFSECQCDECEKINILLKDRTRTEIPKELGDGVVLLSRNALHYFMPGLLLQVLDEESFLGDCFFGMICEAISKKEPPKFHQKLGPLTREQTMVICELFDSLRNEEAGEELLGKEYLRGQKNWQWFLSQAEQ